MQLIINKECIRHIDIILLSYRSLPQRIALLISGNLKVKLRLDIAKANILLRLFFPVIGDLVYFSLHGNRILLLCLFLILLLLLHFINTPTNTTQNSIFQINTVLNHKPNNPLKTLYHKLHLTILRTLIMLLILLI